MLDQPLTKSSFVDALGNTCQLGNSASLNVGQGRPVVVVNNQVLINFNVAPVSNYSFTFPDSTDPSGTTYDVRWAVIITGALVTCLLSASFLAYSNAGATA